MNGTDATANHSNQRIVCKWLVNNQELSDIKFLVGPKKDLVYAHKMILASGSPVFKSYFYADHDLKIIAEPIEVPDLSTIGFINMIKFFYGYDVSELDLSELYETYLAADKYLVNDLNELREYVKTTLNVSNCCLIYDQLLKLPNEDVLELNDIKRMIQYQAKAAFKSESFTKIDRHTLVTLLELDLNIDEIDILKSCLHWAEMECSTNGMTVNSANVREIFKPIKHLIRLFNDDDDSDSEFHLQKAKKRKIDCKSLRETWKLFAIEDCGESFFCLYVIGQNLRHWLNPLDTGTVCGFGEKLKKISFQLNANCPVWIKSIHTHLPTTITNLSLMIYENDEQIDLKIVKKSKNNRWNFRFNECLHIEPNQVLKLIFEFKMFSFDDVSHKLSKKSELRLLDGNMQPEFRLNLDNYHCIQKIKFYFIIPDVLESI